MAFWSWRGLRRGVVTTRYPAHPDPSSTLLPTPPTFAGGRVDPDLARLLVEVCPSGALALTGGQLVLDVGRCTACGRCLDLAGERGRRSAGFEWASSDRSRLLIGFQLGERP
ncbi:MAG: hypothetical protein WBU92_06875 [Candidatus Dormiibacterota bacterium]